MVTYRLPVDGATLEIDASNMDWAVLGLHRGSEFVRVGAEAFGVMAQRLVTSLVGELKGQPAGEVEGAPVWWVMSLSDPHAALYAADHGGCRRIFIQDENGRIVASISLSVAAREELAKTLTMALQGASRAGPY